MIFLAERPSEHTTALPVPDFHGSAQSWFSFYLSNWSPFSFVYPLMKISLRTNKLRDIKEVLWPFNKADKQIWI